MMAAGFLGAAVLLVLADVLSCVGGGQTTVVGRLVPRPSGLGGFPQQIYEEHVGSVVEIAASPATYDYFGRRAVARRWAPASWSPRRAIS